jgi:glycine betaine/proline transport system substrate-binding protein
MCVGDTNAQNQRMFTGENSQQQILAHTDAWIKGHQATFDSWIAQALTADKP